MDLKQRGADVMSQLRIEIIKEPLLTQGRFFRLDNPYSQQLAMLCYYGDDMEEYMRWEDNIKMDLK